jgi:hypothetical protein
MLSGRGTDLHYLGLDNQLGSGQLALGQCWEILIYEPSLVFSFFVDLVEGIVLRNWKGIIRKI